MSPASSTAQLLRLPGRPAARPTVSNLPRVVADPGSRVAVTDCHYWRHPRPAIPAGSVGVSS